MARIKCKNCGKVYRYETEGCCPECGAYNRPPRREQINADGTVYHMNSDDYMGKNRYERLEDYDDKVCFEEKECHEEKVCYEEKTRSTKSSPISIAPMLNQIKQQNSNKKKKKSNAGIIAIIIALVGIVANSLVSCSGPQYDYSEPDYEEPYITQYTVQDDEVTVYLENAAEVHSGTLCYYNQENEYLEIGTDIVDFYGEECTMTFFVGDDYQYAESVDVTYGDDDWISLWVGDMEME